MNRRRQMVIALGAATLVASLPSFAQQQRKVSRIGLLTGGAPITDDSPFGSALIRGLSQRGYVLDRNLAFERRAAQGQANRLPKLVDELVASRVDVIVSFGYPPALTAKQRAGAVPIVAIGCGDPVATGLAASLARPGGNLTGITELATELSAKRLELLKETVPKLRNVALLWNTEDYGMTLRYRAADAEARILGVTVIPLGVRDPDDFKTAFAAMTRKPPDAILMVTDALTMLNRKQVFEFAAMHRLPAIYEYDFLVSDGGLMSYGPNLDELYGRASALTDRILKGTRPAELPIEQPTRFSFALNLKTAKALGIKFPNSILVRADKVIE